MIHNTQITASGGGASSEWALLPAAAQTRAPSYSYFSFAITIDNGVPKAVLFKSTRDTYSYDKGIAYIFGISKQAYDSEFDVLDVELNDNLLTGCLQYNDTISGPFYYLLVC